MLIEVRGEVNDDAYVSKLYNLILIHVLLPNVTENMADFRFQFC